MTGTDFPDRALTLWQPWAWLVMHGFKPIENRPKSVTYSSFRGPIWIHSGLHFDEERYDMAAALLRRIHPYARMPARSRFLDYPRGVILGRVNVIGVLPPGGSKMDWHFEDHYGFILRDVVKLAQPVKCRGYQGIWTVPSATLEELRKAA